MKAKTFTKILTPALALSMLLSNSAFAEAVSEAESSEASAETVSAQTASKVRTIITTDGEVDDQCSLVRYLLYANEFELEGIVSTSSMFHYTDQGEGMFKGKDSNQEILDAYAEVYDNLSTHAEGYPTPEFLTEHNFEGNVTQPGEMGTRHRRLSVHQRLYYGREGRPSSDSGLGRVQHHRCRSPFYRR